MKIINLYNIMKKLNRINYTMKNLIFNKDGSYDCGTNFTVPKELVYNGKLIISFDKINGNFSCDYIGLKSLEGCPKEINGSFMCYSNELTSLKYCPKEVNGSFYCSHNELTSLENCPEKINVSFDCSYNKLTSLKYCPKIIKGNFYCRRNSEQFTEEMIRKVCNVKDVIYN
jgi:hypothetical protein